VGQRAKLTEADFTAQVLAFARLHGWLTAHFRPARTKTGWRTAVSGQGKGFPDVILARERIVVAELKIGRNKVTPEQQQWLSAFRAAGVEAFVWTEQSWPEIESVLRR
jgi:hypothetical protein